MKPFISVIIPCRNEAPSLSRCLDSILNSDYPADRMEVIVADGASEDSSRALLDYYADRDRRVRWIDNQERITPAGLNLAISEAGGDYILRVDAHSLLASNYISQIAALLSSHPDAWGAGGQMSTLPETSGGFSEAIRIVLSHRFGVGNSRFRTHASDDGTPESAPFLVDTVFNCCWRREVFTRIGMFHEQLVRSQDIELSSRIAEAGGTLWLVPEARTTYFAKSRLASYVKHNWMNGIWSVLPAAFTGKLPVRWRHLIPLAFVGSLLLSAILAIGFPQLRWFPFVVAGPYIAANLGASLEVAWRTRRAILLATLPVAFAGLHLAYGSGSLWGCVQFVKQRRSSVREAPPMPVSRSARSVAASAGTFSSSSKASQ